MLNLLVRTNPSRPGVTPFSLAQDLLDIPKQLKDVGRLIRSPKSLLSVREVANQNLGVQFGWLPLFQDVKDLLGLGEAIHKRNGELQRLYSSKGLKRRLQLGVDNAVASGDVSSDSTILYHIVQHVSTRTERQRWGTVRWLPNIVPGHRPSDAEIFKQAKRVALGLSVEGVIAGSWDLLPWSFLIDYFTNAGKYAQQFSNTVPATPTSACIMTKTETFQNYLPVNRPPEITGGEGQARLLSKARYTGSGSISASLPYIGLDRLSILSSLFVQRFK